MASTTQDELYQTFLSVSGQQTAALGDATSMLSDVVAQIDELRNSNPAPVTASKAESTTQTTSSSSGSTLGSVATSVLESGFGLAPLISGLVGLFGGGGTPAPAPLVKYAMPAAANFQAEESQGQVTGLQYDQTGMPRSYAPAATDGAASGTAQNYDPMGTPANYAPEANLGASAGAADYSPIGMPLGYAPLAASGSASGTANGGASGTANSGGNGGGSGNGSGAAPQITVNVQAMDARSFMDRSSDIAAAVRDAMLNLNSINDVVNDL